MIALPPKHGLLPALDFKEQLLLLRQDINIDMVNCMKAAFSEVINLMANKPPQISAASTSEINNAVQQALETNRDFKEIKNDISR